jgi:hypothetical protein
MENLLKQLIQLALFSAFIHAVIEVVKAISGSGVLGIVKELSMSLIKNTGLSKDTIKTLVFALALLYCYGFDFGAMSDMLGVGIADDDNFAWFLDYIGTASVVFVGVEWFYQKFKKFISPVQADLKASGG